MDKLSTLVLGDCLEVLRGLPDECVQTCVTSPPYWGLRDYGVPGQLGQESTPEDFVFKLTEIFREVRRVLKPDGTLWLNLGDSYTSGNRKTRDHDKKCEARHLDSRAPTPVGLKPKDLIGIPWRVAFALQADGWYLRSDIIWQKPNCMPESVKDRPTKAHEYIFLFSKNEDYLYDQDAIREPHSEVSLARAKRGRSDEAKYAKGAPGQTSHTLLDDMSKCCHPKGRNKRTVWTISTKPLKAAHFATYPPDLILPCILAGSRPGDLVLDPFNGAGTTGLVALENGRAYLGIELNPEYLELTQKRLQAFQAQIEVLSSPRINFP